MIPCLKTCRVLLRARLICLSIARASYCAGEAIKPLDSASSKPSLETSQKICLSAPAFPCSARESKSCQVQYPQRLRPRCPPSSASVRDCTAMSSPTREKKRVHFLLGGREKAELHTCWSGQTACTWPQHAAPPALSNSRPQGQWAFTTPVTLAWQSLRRQRGEPSCIPVSTNQGSPRLCAKLAGPKNLRGTTQKAK
jgi:hypothetical protein